MITLKEIIFSFKVIIYIYSIALPIVCCFVSWRLGCPHWGNADGTEGIFGFCRTHFKKGLVPYLSDGRTDNKQNIC